MTPQLLIDAVGLRPDVATTWAVPLTAACDRYAITLPGRAAMFLAQLAHESDNFTCLLENLNYSAEGLRENLAKHFDQVTAQDYAHQPRRIAARSYAGINGNGDEDSADGWTYRSRGPIQLMGRAMYEAFGKACGVDLVAQPDLLLRPDLGAWSGGWFWSTHNLNAVADRGDVKAFRECTRVINGGYLGESDREIHWQRILAGLKRTTEPTVPSA